MTGLLFTIVFFPLVGLAASRILGTVPWFLAGVGASGMILFALGVARVPLVPSIAVLVVLCLIVALVKPRRPRETRAFELRAQPLFPTALMLIAAAASLIVSAVVPLTDYDGRWFWLLKAKAIAHEGRVGGPFFHMKNADPDLYFLQRPPNAKNRYPLLLPVDAAAIMVAARDLDERHVRWLYALIPISFALEIRRRFSRLFSPEIGAWLGALFLWIPAVALDQHGGATTAYSDLALGAFAGCALFALFEAESPARAGFWIACVALTKDEGTILALLLTGLAACVFRRKFLAALIPITLAAATLAGWAAMVPRTDEEHLFGRLALLPERLDLFDDTVVAFARYCFRWSDWGLLWPVAAVALALLIWWREWRVVLLAGTVLVAMIGVYSVVYTVTNWNTSELLHASARRLLIHLVGPAFLMIGAAVHRTRQDLSNDGRIRQAASEWEA